MIFMLRANKEPWDKAAFEKDHEELKDKFEVFWNGKNFVFESTDQRRIFEFGKWVATPRTIKWDVDYLT